MRTRLFLCACFWSVASLQGLAETTLFDFESEADIAAWHDEGKTSLAGDKQLRRIDRFTASGDFSLQFQTPAWRPEEHGGQQRWPAFEGKPPIADWSKFDRLVIEVVNATASSQKLSLFVSDSKRPTRQGAHHTERLAPRSHTRMIFPVRQEFAQKNVDPRDIHVMHFYTEDPPVDMAVFLDRMLLLEPGEEVPPLPAGYLRQIAALYTPAVESMRETLASAADRLKAATTGSANVARWAAAAVADLDRQVADLAAGLKRAEPSVVDAPLELARIDNTLANLESMLAFRLDFEKVRSTVQADQAAATDTVVGFAGSMEKVLPRAAAVSVKARSRVELALARNEEESFQAVVIPHGRELKAVEVQVSDLKSADGALLSVGNVEAVPVGYVETKHVPPYGSTVVGWWPDPILDFLRAVDIAAGDAQAFWVRVHAPKDQSAGVYQGKLTILAGGSPLFVFDLAVRIYGFQTPDASPLPLAITFSPHDHPTPETRDRQSAWRQSADYPINAWKKHKAEWADFLADYYITYDSLYGYKEPDFEILKQLKAEGRLGWFNLGYFDKFSENPAAASQWITGIRSRCEKSKELGLLDHAYIYGCDENPADVFPQVERTAAMIKAAFPDVPVMTTTYDHSYGLDSVIQSIDAWCPLTPRFDLAKAEQARGRGRQVWWYICCGPHHPHANMFVEYPAIEGRLLMGAMTAKYRPDGFLYYQISIWNSQRPIESGPFTAWDPRSWTSYHGDGSWTCVGPDGTPLSTIRLENFRDGLEDYAYFRILEATVAKVESSDEQRRRYDAWLKAAKPLLVVPAEVVKSLTEYTRDPAILYDYRNRLAEAIESAGIPPADPWQ
ncbi:MAG: DUF4091 domain-containing protein [Rhodopirellula sp.]|nr:DUF4091 domain-containing protein [Rhodopirellula sp.]